MKIDQRDVNEEKETQKGCKKKDSGILLMGYFGLCHPDGISSIPAKGF